MLDDLTGWRIAILLVLIGLVEWTNIVLVMLILWQWNYLKLDVGWLLQSVLAAKRGAWNTVLRWLSRFSLMNIRGRFLAIMASLAAYCIFNAHGSHPCFCITIFYLLLAHFSEWTRSVVVSGTLLFRCSATQPLVYLLFLLIQLSRRPSCLLHSPPLCLCAWSTCCFLCILVGSLCMLTHR